MSLKWGALAVLQQDASDSRPENDRAFALESGTLGTLSRGQKAVGPFAAPKSTPKGARTAKSSKAFMPAHLADGRGVGKCFVFPCRRNTILTKVWGGIVLLG